MPQPRVPTAILEARGAFIKHPERRREREGEPESEGPLGDPPSDLNREQKQSWVYLASLVIPGVAKKSDRAAFEEMACLRVICKSQRATAAERQQYANYLAKFGMNPSDRSRVKVAKGEQKKSPVSEFLGPVH